ncbi:iron chelate uptake ABC transporter family permease subunit [Sphingobacterium spiritivorum]|uniref:Iron chelate uptake ABC transporter, FeCT family, permease protein n=1 Tax=Sphingobacterium spiritivorum ATCC 33861 TaxID=525373 RepID=D7VR22_SPHSI|nr:iron chelate uptake ABC transporter family permease subunit [Sphingobacterium spiritivorum]EFK56223.1 iron chelate uptake ABC transporter, FeCT family, permease protein [Sphingobacterium spiritivorum ATCC 33861]QQT35673.1 iron chelate uptake ABC transporter family permease subunit [Sphingobacterium spiritivorum]WQD32385.1 iron chelate uptake ABC transporter family permease subunit [Sphingobacterium spiritivorum]SUJ08781.1 Iron(III)-hydroxamate import system permease protein fhuB [Sphingobact
MKQQSRIWIMLALFATLIVLFLFYDMGRNIDYVLPRRAIRLATIIVVGISVAYSSMIFQTITNNKILTPSIMGYESIFILFQTIIVFVYGDKTFQVISQTDNFFYAILLMLFFSWVMYMLIFGKGKRNIYHLLLIGLILGTLFQTLSQFMQIVIDPNEFSVIEGYMFVSFNKMNSSLLLIASVVLLATLLWAQRYVKYLDVIALGREHAVNLGLDYNRLIKRYMLIISLLVSVSTALVGPVTFLGILVTNLTYELIPSSRHKVMIWICGLIACIALIAGQFMVEHVFNFSTTVSIVINFSGGVYFMYLILKSRKRL